jgi:hypothetical protein
VEEFFDCPPLASTTWPLCDGCPSGRSGWPRPCERSGSKVGTGVDAEPLSEALEAYEGPGSQKFPPLWLCQNPEMDYYGVKRNGEPVGRLEHALPEIDHPGEFAIFKFRAFDPAAQAEIHRLVLESQELRVDAEFAEADEPFVTVQRGDPAWFGRFKKVLREHGFELEMLDSTEQR